MKDLLNNGFQIVSETEMLMVEGGVGDNGPQKGKDPLCPLPDEGGGKPKKPDPIPGGGSGSSCGHS
ncbi:hypothetical protein E4O04_13320 [Treponema sp. OMZ 799]|uniref:hypothetical protein n=1 Tax=Treponema sp. OMZ 799 TaxID=2563668 RepID=UPI0020A36D8E|nr:hypothetical protein [Treponema sp. OMZ 799]UTC78925.1 hypothetical protein E4O04_13320 [Treponema sp. OMZ 799]